MADLVKIREKISALLKRNEANGASEAEAIAAMGHAARLMEEHGITITDILERSHASTDFIQEHVNKGEKNLSVFDKLVCPAIARYTDTKAWNDKSEKRMSKLMFFGYRVDVELAEYIRNVCERAGETEWKKFSRNIATGDRTSKRKSFFIGMAVRLSERLDEMKIKNTQSGDGRQLVIMKSELVKRAYSEKNMKMRSEGRITFYANNAFSAGKTAAENVRFNREIYDGPSGGIKLIS